MYTVVITIGSNVGDTPMSSTDWFGFRKQVANDLADVQAVPLQMPAEIAWSTQVGYWEGKKEEAAAYVAVVHSLGRLARLQNNLRMTAAAYRQDAIGFIVVQGTKHFA